MVYQSVFKRYELKYLITDEQKDRIIRRCDGYLRLDGYGRSSIRNLYFDTDSYLLIRRSIEKPVYKEKLRLRSYGTASSSDIVFAELKKKYKSTVYKRRIATTESKAVSWIGGGNAPVSGQIADEIEYAARRYGGLLPKIYLSYEREAYFLNTTSDFRVTFDEKIMFREEGLSLSEEPGGTNLLDSGMTLMEIKCGGAIPLWLVKILSEEKIYKTSFSKYGTAYKNHILPRITNSAKICYIN